MALIQFFLISALLKLFVWLGAWHLARLPPATSPTKFAGICRTSQHRCYYIVDNSLPPINLSVRKYFLPIVGYTWAHPFHGSIFQCTCQLWGLHCSWWQSALRHSSKMAVNSLETLSSSTKRAEVLGFSNFSGDQVAARSTLGRSLTRRY